MPHRLRPSSPFAADALLPGDPGRALMLAQELLDPPKMSNHARGLWGYTGPTAGGGELTIQSTGMGGPSATIVLADLAELGVRRAIRVGTCAAVDGAAALGELIAVERALADGLAGVAEFGDSELSAAVAAAAAEAGGRAGSVLSTDLGPALRGPEHGNGSGAIAVEMECAALFGLAPKLGVAVAALLIVSESGGERLADEDLEERAKLIGRVAVAALAAPAAPA